MNASVVTNKMESGSTPVPPLESAWFNGTVVTNKMGAEGGDVPVADVAVMNGTVVMNATVVTNKMESGSTPLPPLESAWFNGAWPGPTEPTASLRPDMGKAVRHHKCASRASHAMFMEL
ncbi:MAG: hypothetical protein KGJ88_13340 [Verrucomicrobiota bacterium]|nr:hypothetical protein [Verrucomicrobiota bacterium]